jgi:hypothetical protein
MLALPRKVARLANIAVAAIFALVATQLLIIGFESEPPLAGTVESITDWIRRPPLAGAGALLGVLLTTLGVVVLAGAFWPLRLSTPSITTRRSDGWTRLDRSSLSAALDRELAAVDTTAEVSSVVHRSGQVDLEIDSLDAAVDGPGTKIRAALDELVDRRHLPCRVGKISIQPRRATRRRQRILR